MSDLSGYEVRFVKTMLGGWRWEAEAPDGDHLEGVMQNLSRDNAEREALRHITAHAEQPPPLSGAELKERVEGQGRGARLPPGVNPSVEPG